MSTSRAQSQNSQYARRRSNTAQSVFKNIPQSATPVKLGGSKTLVTWVHDPKESPVVIFNHVWWPGVSEGDILNVTAKDSRSGFLFIVPKDEGLLKPQLQMSIPRPMADRFSLRNNEEITVTKVDKDTCRAGYIEFTFQDQYLGRNEMWRLGQHLVGQCVYEDQEISFIGVISAKVSAIYIDRKKVPAGYVTSSTKAVYRSLSAKTTIFIQVCREFWEFASDGERYYEKVVQSFLPALFTKWREAGTNHIVTIVLISRVFYDESEIEYAAGSLRRDEEGRWCKDFFKVIADLEVIHDWKSTLVSLKDSFWQFQRDILLDHHYFQASLGNHSEEPVCARLAGQISFAHEGPILEAVNLGLNPTETHYIDRSLSLTGSSTILITPGPGYFRVSKQLLRLTTTRMLDQGFGLDCVSLSKPPLHQSPIFCFQGLDPELKLDRDGKGGYRTMDPLWGGDNESNESVDKEKSTFWWEPFWMNVSFWDKQMDLPLRRDRFVARAKMHTIASLGLLDHDVVSSIGIPFLPDSYSSAIDTLHDNTETTFSPSISKADADLFDSEIFLLKRDTRHPTVRSRNSVTSCGSGTLVSSLHLPNDKRSSKLSSTSRIIPSREENSRALSSELSELESRFSTVTSRRLSTSPSKASVLSKRSVRSSSTVTSANNPETTPRRPRSKFAPSWLFNSSRSGLSQPQTSAVSASASGVTTPTEHSSLSPITTTMGGDSTIASSLTAIPRPPKPVNIQPRASPRNSFLSRTLEEDSSVPHRGSLKRNSPLASSPRDDPAFAKRRGSQFNFLNIPFPSSLHTRTNPSAPGIPTPYSQASLARRWQHIFPEPLWKHGVKWKSMITPACLPLTVEHFPTKSELELSYDVFSYDFVVDPPEMWSFLVRPPTNLKGGKEEVRRILAGAIMREMVALRLAQGFQFVLRPSSSVESPNTVGQSMLNQFSRQSHVFAAEDDLIPQVEGAADVLSSTYDPIYLCMTNEIHRIVYSGDSIQVRRYVRRMPVSRPIEYQCLIWPKLGEGYTELKTSFVSRGLENYGWNRLDMLIAGYESQFNESLRFWRTRFVVIPTAEPPLTNIGPNGEKLNDEEIRLVGMDKLAELFSRIRWQPPDESSTSSTLIRFLPTDLGPAACILDESLMSRLEEIHSLGPLKKKINSEREIGGMSLAAIAKAMREDDGVHIRDYKWHAKKYSNAFLGSDFVNWLVREFRDVSSREQAAEIGVRLQAQGLFDHCRGMHTFLDGHYFYQLKGEYTTPSTPRGWFRSSRHVSGEEASVRSGLYYPSSNTGKVVPNRRVKKQLIMSQSVVIDIDSNKRSDQAEMVILHHDIVHNPATCFHFELHWIGTTARCIEDLLRQWSWTIERYGLKLVESYVGQICDIRDRNPFQSCSSVRLAVHPPVVPDLERRIPEGAQARHYFECAILRKFGFLLDIEAGDAYPDHVDAVYPYRGSVFKYSQWVHRSGVVFAQLIGGKEGFLMLTNRLMGPGRMGTSLKSKEQRTGALADEIVAKMEQFCSDRKALIAFYDEELAMLIHVAEDPPLLRI